MRTVLKGKTQEFIQGGITPSGLATQVRRGIIKAFDSTTYRATVQLLGSLSVWLEGVPVAHYIRPNLLTTGTRCGVAFFDESNPADACLAFTYDGLPPSGDLPLLQGAARNIYVQQRASNTSGDNLSIRAGDAGAGAGAYGGGNLYLHGGAGVSGGYGGDVALAYTGSAVRGSVGIGGAPPAGQTGRLYTYGQIYPGTGSAIQTSRHISDDGTNTTVSGPLKAGDFFTVDWTDYSALSTIVGFSSYYTRVIQYRKVGRIVFVYFNIYGPASGTEVSFTLPYNNTMPSPFWTPSQSYDNSTPSVTPGRVDMSSGGNVVYIYKDYSSGAWTASGNRSVTGEFWFPTAS